MSMLAPNICSQACYCGYILIAKVTNSPENPKDKCASFFYIGLVGVNFGGFQGVKPRATPG